MRYHGGKWILAPWIISHFPEHRIYCEPYGGAASVLLRKERAYAEVYNDLDGETVNVFRVMQNPESARELERLLRLTPFARSEFAKAYRPARNPIERARRTLLRSFAGHGSGGTLGRKTGFRCDTRRAGSTPAHDWAGFPDQVAFFLERLQGVVIESRPALRIIEQYDSEETLIFVDLPYVHATRSSGKYRHEMTDHQHRELADMLKSVQGKVVLSGYPCGLYDRAVSRLATGRAPSPGRWGEEAR